MDTFGGMFSSGLIVVFFAVFWFFVQSVRILKEYERGVVFRLGRIIGAKGPGMIFLIPFVDRMNRVDLRTVTMDVPPQDIITKDNVTMKVNAVVYFRVVEPTRAIVEVEQYLVATSQLAQTTLRSVLGQVELDTLLGERERLNKTLQEILDTQTDPWGVKVSHVEIKGIDLPVEMQRAMARQAEAERERRAKIIAAEGEMQASEKLSQAAVVLSENPVSLQLRYLQSMIEMANDRTSTIIIPFPMDLIKPFLQKATDAKS
jgi:regulator of protease activity HflC (stomatin/prohibitin superfamily)